MMPTIIICIVSQMPQDVIVGSCKFWPLKVLHITYTDSTMVVIILMRHICKQQELLKNTNAKIRCTNGKWCSSGVSSALHSVCITCVVCALIYISGGIGIGQLRTSYWFRCQ